MGKFSDLFQIKVKIGQNVNLIDDQCVANLEDQRVFQGLVVPFRHGENLSTCGWRSPLVRS